jgi:hypothetical protein
MMLAERFAGTTMIGTKFDATGANAIAYAAKPEGGYRIAVFNKDAARDLTIRVDLAGAKAKVANAWRLTRC